MEHINKLFSFNDERELVIRVISASFSLNIRHWDKSNNLSLINLCSKTPINMFFEGRGGLEQEKIRKKSMHLNHRNVETWIQLWLHEIGIYNWGPLEFPIYIVEQTKCCLKLFLLKIFSLANLLYFSWPYGNIKHKIKRIKASVFSCRKEDRATNDYFYTVVV